MHIVVVGGSGFLGRALMCRIRNYPDYTVTNIDPRAQEDKPDSQRLDLQQQTDIHRAFERICCSKHDKNTALFHLAGLGDVAACRRNPELALHTNVMLTLNLLQTAAEFGCKKFIYPSSALVYNEAAKSPINEESPTRDDTIYSLAKLTGEKIIKQFSPSCGVKSYILRLANVFGPESGANTVLGTIFDQALQRPSCIALRKLKPRRDYIYIEDVVGCFMSILQSDSSFGVSTLNISSGTSTSVQELADIACEVLGLQCKIEATEAEDDPTETVLCNSRAREELGWEPRFAIRDSIRACLMSRGTCVR